MSTVMVYVLFVVGLVLIVKGGDWFVDSAVWLAEVSGIPKFIIGATIVSVATTLPELLVSTLAAAKGETAMAIGNAAGSVNANIGLIMAISIIFIPIAINRRAFAFKPILMICSILALIAFTLGGKLTLVGAVIMLGVFVVFIIENILSAKKSDGDEKTERRKSNKKETVEGIAKFIFGTAGIAVGAWLLVEKGKAIAEMLGVSKAIISVIFIAIGTSLPELVTTITAIVKKQGNLSVGNIIGANVFNLTLIMPICSLISGGSLPISEQNMKLDLPFCALFCGIAVIPTLIAGKFRRWQGFALLAVYAVFIALSVIFFGAAA